MYPSFTPEKHLSAALRAVLRAISQTNRFSMPNPNPSNHLTRPQTNPFSSRPPSSAPSPPRPHVILKFKTLRYRIALWMK
jgi:hypothetical protein